MHDPGSADVRTAAAGVGSAARAAPGPEMPRDPAVTSRRWLSRAVTLAAWLVVWAALVVPGETGRLSAASLLRIPLEGLVFVAVVIFLRRRPRTVVAVAFGLALGALVLLSVLDYAFDRFLDRPFDLLGDWRLFDSAIDVFGDSVGHRAAVATAVLAGVTAVAVVVLLPMAALRVSRTAAGNRRTALRALAAASAVWALGAAAGLHVAGAPFASVSAATATYDEVVRVRANLADRHRFAAQIASDDFAGVRARRLVSALRGKDVLVVFVESYGRVAVEGASFSAGVRAVLDSGTDRLRRAGYRTRSAWLTSPTYGAESWLAHASLQSGLWVDSDRRYAQLLDSDRLTLTDVFGRAGWRTVFAVPANTRDWPEGEDFYDVDRLYDSRNSGYQGPAFSYGDMPDQYTLDHFRRVELAPRDRPPVMAEIDLVSSHHPWAPVPHLVPWRSVGDGSVFDGMPEQGESPDVVFRDGDAVRAAYGESIEYSLSTLVSWLERYPDPDRVLVVLGDHQPHGYISGDNVGHDVPISVISSDPGVLTRIQDWHWVPGLRPTAAAPVWPMDTFRDRFFTAYGSQRGPTAE